jgi:hypothetical protein
MGLRSTRCTPRALLAAIRGLAERIDFTIRDARKMSITKALLMCMFSARKAERGHSWALALRRGGP